MTDAVRAYLCGLLTGSWSSDKAYGKLVDLVGIDNVLLVFYEKRRLRITQAGMIIHIRYHNFTIGLCRIGKNKLYLSDPDFALKFTEIVRGGQT